MRGERTARTTRTSAYGGGNPEIPTRSAHAAEDELGERQVTPEMIEGALMSRISAF